MESGQEHRMRRILRRQGFALVKSRKRNPAAPDFDKYWIVVVQHRNRVSINNTCMSMNEIEAWTNERTRALIGYDEETRMSRDKARERRVRRRLSRHGLLLLRSRRRDSSFPDYGRYWVVEPQDSCWYGDLVFGMDLDEVEAGLPKSGAPNNEEKANVR